MRILDGNRLQKYSSSGDCVWSGTFGGEYRTAAEKIEMQTHNILIELYIRFREISNDICVLYRIQSNFFFYSLQIDSKHTKCTWVKLHSKSLIEQSKNMTFGFVFSTGLDYGRTIMSIFSFSVWFVLGEICDLKFGDGKSVSCFENA